MMQAVTKIALRMLLHSTSFTVRKETPAEMSCDSIAEMFDD